MAKNHSQSLSIQLRQTERPALISIIAPAYNEEDNLIAFEGAVRSVLSDLGQAYEIVFVNDGSDDQTLALMHDIKLRAPNTTIVDLSRNFGKEIATTAGLDHARGDAAVIIDTDLQDPPEVIGELIAGWREGYDVVYAKRRLREGESWLKRGTAKIFYKLMANIGDTDLPADVGDFRLLSRKAIDAVCSLRERHRFMKGVFAWVGFPAKEVLYDRKPRHAGLTKWNYWKLWNLSIEGITSSTLAPLKLSTYFGFLSAFAAFVFGVFFVIKTVFFGDEVPGFPTLIVVILFLGGVQLMVLGVIGEYLGRVFNETKDRPLYFVNQLIESENQSHRVNASEAEDDKGGAEVSLRGREADDARAPWKSPPNPQADPTFDPPLGPMSGDRKRA